MEVCACSLVSLYVLFMCHHNRWIDLRFIIDDIIRLGKKKIVGKNLFGFFGDYYSQAVIVIVGLVAEYLDFV